MKHHPNGTCNYMCELIANICSVRSAVRHICRVAATRYFISIVVSSCQHCNAQQLQTCSDALYMIFSVIIFEICILEVLEMYLITHDHQFGFKSKHSTDMCIFTVKSIVKAKVIVPLSTVDTYGRIIRLRLLVN